MHRGKRQRIAPSLTEYLLSIRLDPSTTSNSIEGLYRSFNLQCKQQKHTIVPVPLVKWQIDLADMQNSAEALDYIFRIKINNKAYKPMILLSDNGKEFIAKEVKQVCIIERFNKTIKQKIAQYLSVYRTQRYIDALELITLLIPQLHNYYKYLNDKNNPIISETLHYTRGDKIRIQAHITPFIAPEQQRRLSAKTKSTVPNWSSEVYTVTKKIIDEVKQVCTDHGIHQLMSFPYTPLGIIERFNKTIKQKIAQYLSVYRTQRYIDALELITENYNHSYHHTIREMPANVHFANRSLHKLLIPQLHNYYKYLNDKNNPIIPKTLHYARGDKVRIQAHITPFIAPEQQRKLSAKTKSTVPTWSSVYTVTKKIIDDKFIFYQVKAASGVVYHRKYYHWQLQKQ
ncbi:hypothetical protein PROFUN_09048 [Planoprotostelium fungivorum]|uniref:Integrase catalytic domain-containing protein n=1 Tax=Planoprotostelium fungivorum TaxID=1890364 RepID=A0A2P6MV21_9EUKA|nr:hypothetical protein PROFUN_09048 [Planoprotostelium fungivorum]